MRQVGKVFSNRNLGQIFITKKLGQKMFCQTKLAHAVRVRDMHGEKYLSWKRRGKDGGKGFVLTWKPKKQIDK